jgi:hypothetical protein
MSRKSKKRLQKSKAYKEKGIVMWLKMPENVAIAIPENKPGSIAPIECDIWFKNHISLDVPFINLVPKLIAPDGQRLTRKAHGTPANNYSTRTTSKYYPTRKTFLA